MFNVSKISVLAIATIGMTILSGCQQDTTETKAPTATQTKVSTSSPEHLETPPAPTTTGSLAELHSIVTALSKKEVLNKDLSNAASFKSNLNKVVFKMEIASQSLDKIQRIEIIPDSYNGNPEYVDLSEVYEKDGFYFVKHETRLPIRSNSNVKYKVKTVFVDESTNETQLAIMPDLFIDQSSNESLNSHTQGIMPGNNDFDTIVFNNAHILIGSQNISIYSKTLVSVESSIETFEESMNDQASIYGLSGGELTITTQESYGQLNVTMRGLNGKPGSDNNNPQVATTTAGEPGSPAKIRVVKYKDIDIKAIIHEEVCTIKAGNGHKGPKGLTGRQGGTGSKGGDSGSFLFITNSQTATLQLNVNLIAGKGGIGGFGGPGGKGGPGGQPGQDHPACDSKAQVGPQGDDGDRGPRGVNGEDGKINTKKVQYL